MSERSLIMVVDDDRALLDMAEKAIGDDYDVTLALSGAQALKILSNGFVPELIVLDIDMPDMDGYETLRRIHEIPPLAEIPVIYLTGLSGSEPELAGLALGAQDYITKPFVRENLLARIKLRLENGRKARQLREIREMSDLEETRFAQATKELTPAEREVARLILRGLGNQEIAAKLHYSMGYVKNMSTLIYEKLEVHNRAGLRARFQG
ncbi:MAG: DNA-binding response regulator [Clostridiales bacterium]|jgi:DNA-binding NarL/FixJ family response regulator|nr:DNA-binding response regulator [Clostridiales bacterium]